MYKHITTLVCLCIFITGYSQSEWGAEYQHGFGKSSNSNSIGGLYEGFSNTGKSSWQLGINYTFSSSGSGKDASKSSGIGICAGYRYGFSYGNSGNLFTGARLAFTFGKNDKDAKASVFTPSIELGYHYTFNNFGKGMFANPSIGYGYNVAMDAAKKTDNDGEGSVFLTRLAVGYRF